MKTGMSEGKSVAENNVSPPPQLSLDEVLEGKRQATADVTRSATEVALATSLKRRSRAWDDANPELVAGLVRALKKKVCTGAVVDLLHSHMAEEDAKRKVDNKRRASERQASGETKIRVEFKSHVDMKAARQARKVAEWAGARNFLQRFITAGTTDGLVRTPEGTDLSSTGPDVMLKKAQVVCVHCSLRIQGMTGAEAVNVCTLLHQGTGSARSIANYLCEFLEHRRFFETKRGKWV
jgi:hypothetical protein